jgi:hypothetical protein
LQGAAQVRTTRPAALLRRAFIKPHFEGQKMSIGTIILIILVLMLIGAIPAWGHSKSWGYGPSGGLGLVVVILLILLLMGKL